MDYPGNRPKSWTDNGLGGVPSVNLVRALSKTAIFDDALRVFSYGRITIRSRGGMVQELIPTGQGAPPQNLPTAAAGGSCGRLWGKAVLASTSSLPHLSTARPCPSGPHVPGAGWRHPASHLHFQLAMA